MQKTSLFILTGAESSGKTTLATQLCDSLAAPLVPEISREYLREKKTNYLQEDLLAIAKLQHAQETALSQLCPGPIICDTDLLIMIIWSEVKYGCCDDWIIDTFESAIQSSPPRHYLLCDHNIPWQADTLRENPNNRAELFALYQQKLQHYALAFSLLTGNPAQRLKSALRYYKAAVST